jgi:hypothetical protein
MSVSNAVSKFREQYVVTRSFADAMTLIHCHYLSYYHSVSLRSREKGPFRHIVLRRSRSWATFWSHSNWSNRPRASVRSEHINHSTSHETILSRFQNHLSDKEAQTGPIQTLTWSSHDTRTDRWSEGMHPDDQVSDCFWAWTGSFSRRHSSSLYVLRFMIQFKEREKWRGRWIVMKIRWEGWHLSFGWWRIISFRPTQIRGNRITDHERGNDISWRQKVGRGSYEQFIQSKRFQSCLSVMYSTDPQWNTENTI